MFASYNTNRLVTAVGLATCLLAGNAAAAVSTQCETVRFTDPGWTDISSTNALASTVLEGLGYSPEISILGCLSALKA